MKGLFLSVRSGCFVATHSYTWDLRAACAAPAKRDESDLYTGFRTRLPARQSRA